MNKRLWILVAAVVLLGAVGVVGKKQGWWGATGDQLEVETVTIQVHTIVETVNASGKIQPAVDVKISPEVSGEIIALPVVEGQAVKKGATPGQNQSRHLPIDARPGRGCVEHGALRQGPSASPVFRSDAVLQAEPNSEVAECHLPSRMGRCRAHACRR